ncbi:MAG: J domain-containing protein [Campylobacterales bacterium]|nr:J domain-containing protein [Campylobacterales bacterium]
MRLRLTKHATVVELPERSVWFHEITQRLRATFEKTFWVNAYLINLPVKGDEAKRRLFLLELYKTCSKNANKHDSRFLKRLLESSHKPIKVQVVKTFCPSKRVLITLRVINNALHVRLPKEETFVFWHLVHTFKSHGAVHDVLTKELVFKTPTSSLESAITSLLNTPSLFGMTLVFDLFRRALEAFFAYDTQEVPTLTDHYRTLNLAHTAKLDELRQRYLQLAKAHHPDLAANNHDAKVRTQKFQQIQEAYHAIKTQKRDSA